MFGIGANELILILLFGFLIFGPDKLPAMAKTIGQAISKFKSAQDEMSKVIKTEVYNPEAENPFKNPLDALSKLEDSAKKEDQQESFSERKARYDKQRAARKAADASADAKKVSDDAASAAVAVGTAQAESSAVEESGSKPSTSADDGSVAEHPVSKSKNKPAISADDLYGTKPVVKKKPAVKKKQPVEASDTKPAASDNSEEKGE